MDTAQQSHYAMVNGAEKKVQQVLQSMPARCDYGQPHHEINDDIIGVGWEGRRPVQWMISYKQKAGAIENPGLKRGRAYPFHINISLL